MSDIDLTAVDLNLLIALERLLARGNVTSAARDLGVTQPAMSRTLHRLRELLGDPLFVKVGRGVVPTERALALRGPLDEALGAIRRVIEPPERFDPLTARGVLGIALGDEAQVAFADAIVTAVQSAAPGVDVRVRPLSPASLDEGKRGLIDLALAPELSALPARAGAVDLSDMVVKPLYTRRFVVVRSARFPSPLDLDAYCAASHVIVGWEGGGRGFVDDLLEALGRKRRVAATVTSFLSAARLVSATDLVGTMPSEVVPLTGASVVGFEPPFPLPEIPMLLVWDPRKTADPRHRFFRQLVASAITERAAGGLR
jgi:DNA-binding transcriptional LysR family regulator